MQSHFHVTHANTKVLNTAHTANPDAISRSFILFLFLFQLLFLFLFYLFLLLSVRVPVRFVAARACCRCCRLLLLI